MDIVKQILEVDKSFRRHDLLMFEDLHSLSSLSYKEEWNYSYPTLDIENPGRFKQYSLSEFKKELYSTCPYLQYVTFKNDEKSGILLAGGSVGNILSSRYISDFDFFFYGFKTTDDAELFLQKVIKNLISGILSQSSYKSEQDVASYIRNRNALTVLLTTYKFQFIFRIYSSISEILHGFDIGSSSVGFNGDDVFFTSLSKFSFEYKVNILDTTRRSTTYEKRLLKYLERGFKIILPELDITKLSKRLIQTYKIPEICEMPYFVFTFSELINNRIILSKVYKPNSLENDSEYMNNAIEDWYKSFYINMHYLATKQYKNMYYFAKRCELVLTNIPSIGKESIIRFYDKNLYSVYKDGKLNLNFLKKFITVESLTEILNRICSLEELKESKTKIKEYLEELFNRQKAEMCDRLYELQQETGKIVWTVKDPTTQTPLTSSFTPIIADPKEWYGDYYKPF